MTAVWRSVKQKEIFDLATARGCLRATALAKVEHGCCAVRAYVTSKIYRPHMKQSGQDVGRGFVFTR